MIVRPLFAIKPICKSSDQALRILLTRLSCGFPSPADDYLEEIESLDSFLIKHPAATYIGKAYGDSMIERGILDGSYLIVDRHIKAVNGSSIVASVAGELTVKILDKDNQLLLPANRRQKPLPLPAGLEVVCEGVVTYCITRQPFSNSSD